MTTGAPVAARLPWGTRAAFLVVLLAGLPLAALALLEGAGSLLLFVVEARDHAPMRLAERTHTVHDTLLGWVNRPNARVQDLYGPGRTLTTNARGFRGPDEVAPAVPAGMRRVVCSGDSFTLGYGVADDETWCARLAALLPATETVNMGQGAYGIDQAYLWYRRDAAAFAHDVHLLAFIWHDFERLKRADFAGYPKPTLAVAGDSLVLGHVPVPRLTRGRRLRLAIAAAADRLRFVTLARRIGRALALGPGADGDGDAAGDAAAWRVAARVFTTLARLHRGQGRAFRLVYLPTKDELLPGPRDRWRDSVAALAGRTGIALVDLTPALRRLPADSVGPLFIVGSTTGFRSADGHYTAAGNAWVAAQLAPLVAGDLLGAGVPVVTAAGTPTRRLARKR